MAVGFDESKRELLRRIFADAASNVPEFTDTALSGGYRRDEGLVNLLPARLQGYERQDALKKAVVRFLDEGGRPTVEESAGDAEMRMDAATYYHFRITVEDVPLFVKVLLDEEPADPEALVISVKRDDRAWR